MQGFSGGASIVYRSTKIGLDTILDRDKYKHAVRKSKIICTLGPNCDSEEMLGKLLDSGMNIARCTPTICDLTLLFANVQCVRDSMSCVLPTVSAHGDCSGNAVSDARILDLTNLGGVACLA